MLRWLDRLPLSAVVLVAVAFALAPLFPEPHLWEKLKMLAEGALSRPIDIFDLFLHGLPQLLLLMKLLRGTRAGT